MSRLPRATADIAVWLIENALIKGDCFICHLIPNPKGYCYVNVGGRAGRRIRVHRLVYAECFETIPDDMMVLHKCDNRACIRPDHLFLGTAQDNTDNMMAKGRNATDPEVPQRRREFTGRMIGQLYAKGLDRNAIADKLGLSPSTVWNYTNGPYRSSLTLPSRDVD